MAGRYMVSGRSAATAATADNVGAALWNPHSTKPIYVVEAWWFKVTATADNLGLVRTSTRGTQSTTITPDADNDLDHISGNVPISGAVLDIAYSAQPTLQKPYLFGLPLVASVGAGIMAVFTKPILVNHGEGLAFATPQAVVLQAADVTFVWEE